MSTIVAPMMSQCWSCSVDLEVAIRFKISALRSRRDECWQHDSAKPYFPRASGSPTSSAQDFERPVRGPTRHDTVGTGGWSGGVGGSVPAPVASVLGPARAEAEAREAPALAREEGLAGAQAGPDGWT